MMLKSLMICEQTKLRITRRDSLWGAAVIKGQPRKAQAVIAGISLAFLRGRLPRLADLIADHTAPAVSKFVVSNPGRLACNASKVRMSMPAPASRMNDAATCIAAKARSFRVAADDMRGLPLDRTKPFDASDAGRRGTNASNTAAIIASATPTHNTLASRVRSSARTENAPHNAQAPTHRLRNHDAEHGTRGAHHDTFSEQSATRRTRTRAECRPNGELLLTANRSCEDQIGRVGTRSQTERRCRKQHPHHRSRALGNLIAQQARIDAEAGVLRMCLWIRCEHRGMNRAQLCARGFEVRARRQASKDLRHPMFALGLHGRGNCDVGSSRYWRSARSLLDIWHGGLEDTNDGRRPRA
jgi:hypothetical protein